MDEAKEQMLYGLAHCHILKISDNEICWLTGKSDYTACVDWISSRYYIPLILVSMGSQGRRAYYKGIMREEALFLRDDTIETTGAGILFLDVSCIICWSMTLRI